MSERTIYMNNASTTFPKPPEVLEAVWGSLEKPFYDYGRGTIDEETDYLFETRVLISRFFGFSQTDNVIFTANATDSLNALIHGFVENSTGKFHVITTELEHNSVLRPLKTLEKRGKISLSIAPVLKE